MNSRFVQLLAFVIAVVLGNSLHSAEYIQSFRADVQMNEKGGLEITETIVVWAQGMEIKRGIYRDFPIEQISGKTTTFVVTSVMRNGVEEPYHTENSGGGIRLYIGSKDKFIQSGEHTYEISYTTYNHIQYHKHHDELAFDVVPHGFIFPIQTAQVSIAFPETFGDTPIHLEAFSGLQGKYEDDFEMSFQDRTIEIRSTSILNAHEGITIYAIWKTGPIPRRENAELIQTDSISDDLGLPEFNDNQVLIVSILMIVLAIGAYALNGGFQKIKIHAGRNTPPEGLSPALCKYLSKNGSDTGCLAAGIISLAIKGFLRIARATDGDGNSSSPFKAIKLENESSRAALTDDEELLLEQLFSDADEVEFSKENSEKLTDLNRSFSTRLEECSKDCFHPANLSFKLKAIYILGGLLVLGWPFMFGGATNPAMSDEPTGHLIIGVVFFACILGYRYLYALTRMIYVIFRVHSK